MALKVVSQQDLKILKEQLGRPARGVRAIERYCPAGHPQVIRVYPLAGGKPFPTLFWLSCPSLVQQISHLEYQGWIERIERYILEDPKFRARYHQDHRAYIEERWKELTERDRHWIKEQGLESVFLRRGIGGLKDWDKVKCLHMHYAHHRVRENVIGQWLEEHCEIIECS